MTNALVIADDDTFYAAIADGLTAGGVRPLGIGPTQPFDKQAAAVPHTFDEVDEAVQRAHSAAGEIDAIVVAVGAPSPDTDSTRAPWEQVLAEHGRIEDHVLTHAGWARAAMREALRVERPIRVVHVTAVRKPSDDSAAQAIAQLVRSAQDTSVQAEFNAFSISYEGTTDADVRALGQLAARLVWSADSRELAGAELVVGRGWAGIRRHPGPLATISYGGPAIPEWLEPALRDVVSGS